MKAIINGINIEGTPQEIMEYQKLTEEKAQKKTVTPTADTEWRELLPKITRGQTTFRCSQACNCTGACMGYGQNGWFGIFPPDTIVPRTWAHT